MCSVGVPKQFLGKDFTGWFAIAFLALFVSALSFLNAERQARKHNGPIIIIFLNNVFGATWLGIESLTSQTQSRHIIHYTTESGSPLLSIW